MYTFSQPGYLHLCIFLAASGVRWSRGWYAAAAAMMGTACGTGARLSRCAGDAVAADACTVTAATVPTAVRPTTAVVLVLAWLVVVPALAVAGARVTFSRPAVVPAAEATVPVEVATEVVAAVDGAAPMAVADLDDAALAAAAAAAAAAAEDSSDATTDGDTCSVSSGGLGGGVAKPDQQVDGELLLDVTLLAQSRPTSTSTRVDHVVSHGDSDLVGDDETGSSFR